MEVLPNLRSPRHDRLAGFPGEGLRGHMEINRKLGEPDYPATPVMDAWLKKVLG